MRADGVVTRAYGVEGCKRRIFVRLDDDPEQTITDPIGTPVVHPEEEP